MYLLKNELPEKSIIMNAYRYIKNKGKHGSCISEDYNSETLKKKVVVGDEISKMYYVFDTYTQFKKWYDSNTNKCVHEIIFGKDVQKLKFDIDMTQAQLDEIPMDIIGDTYKAKHKNVIKYILDKIIEAFFDVFYTQNLNQLSYNDMIVFNSSGQVDDHYKYSYHVLLLHKINDVKIAKFFTSVVRRICDASIRQCIDRSVNKTTQQFRIYDSKKKDSNRVKKLDSSFGTKINIGFKDTLVKDYTAESILLKYDLPDDVDKQTYGNLSEDMVKYILDRLSSFISYLDAFTYKNTFNNLIYFTRNTASHCNICDRIHDNDHTLYVRVYISKTKKISVYEHCRHNNNSIFLFCFNDSESTESILDRYFKNIDENRDMFEKRSVYSKCYELDRKNIYDEPKMRSYERTSTLVVKANMKLGKTKALIEYMNKYYPSGGIILFITFRITFSQHIKELLSGFTLYSDVTGDIFVNTHNRIIIQLESLHRIQLCGRKIDLLVLDESESILSQFNSGLHRNITHTLNIFKRIITTSHHVICMDANISNKTYYLLHNFRGVMSQIEQDEIEMDELSELNEVDESSEKQEKIDRSIVFHCNINKNASNDKYYITTKKLGLIRCIMESLARNEKIVIATNSIKEVEIMYRLLHQHYPNKEIVAYTSKTPMSVRKEHYSNIHKYWKVDVLMYTPTVSAGLSFEDEWFDCAYGYFVAASCDVETCRQMLGRIRNIKQKKYVLYLSPFNADKHDLSTSYTELKQNMTSLRENTIIDSRDSSMVAILSELPMDDVYKKSMYFNIWIQNKIVQNKSKKWFITRFLDQILSTGASIEQLEDNGSDEFMKKEYIIADKNVERENANRIVIADDLTPEQYSVLSDKDELTVDEALSMKKYQFKRRYDWPHEIRLNDVIKYNNLTSISIFINLRAITKCETIELSLDMIRQEEAKKYSELVNYTTTSDNQSGIDSEIYKDIRYDYQYNRHTIVINTLKLCGFSCIFTPISLTTETFSEYINTNITEIQKNIKTFSTEFNYRDAQQCISTQEEKNKFVVKLVNSGLRPMYGRYISKRDDTYSIQKNTKGELFLFNSTGFPMLLSKNRNHVQIN